MQEPAPELLISSVLYEGTCPSEETFQHFITYAADTGLALKARHMSGCNILTAPGYTAGVVVDVHRVCLLGEPVLASFSEPLSPADLRTICIAWTSAVTDKHEWGYSQASPGIVIERRLKSHTATAAVDAPAVTAATAANASATASAASGALDNIKYLRSRIKTSLTGASPRTMAVPPDFKCFSFNGYTALVSVVTDRFNGWAHKVPSPRPDVHEHCHSSNILAVE